MSLMVMRRILRFRRRFLARRLRVKQLLFVHLMRKLMPIWWAWLTKNCLRRKWNSLKENSKSQNARNPQRKVRMVQSSSLFLKTYRKPARILVQEFKLFSQRLQSLSFQWTHQQRIFLQREIIYRMRKDSQFHGLYLESDIYAIILYLTSFHTHLFLCL